MRNSIFKKAKEISKKLTLEGVTEYQEFWVVKFPDSEDIPIRLECDGSGTSISCTCKHCSIHGDKYWCTFKLSLAYLKVKNK